MLAAVFSFSLKVKLLSCSNRLTQLTRTAKHVKKSLIHIITEMENLVTVVRCRIRNTNLSLKTDEG